MHQTTMVIQHCVTEVWVFCSLLFCTRFHFKFSVVSEPASAQAAWTHASVVISLSSFVNLPAIISLLMTLSFFLFCSSLLLIFASDSFSVSRNIRFVILHTRSNYNISCCNFLPSHIRHLSRISALSAELFFSPLEEQTSIVADCLVAYNMLIRRSFSNIVGATRISTIAHIWRQRLISSEEEAER